MPGITLLGLGPGDPAQLTRAAWEVINSSDEIWLRTNQHPTVAGLPASVKAFSFDDLYESSDSFEAVYCCHHRKSPGTRATSAGCRLCCARRPFYGRSHLPCDRPTCPRSWVIPENCQWAFFPRTCFCRSWSGSVPAHDPGGRVGIEPGAHPGLPAGCPGAGCPDILAHGGCRSQGDPQ